MGALINPVGARKGKEVSIGRLPRSSFFELPRDIYSKELLPEAQALEYKAEFCSLCPELSR